MQIRLAQLSGFTFRRSQRGIGKLDVMIVLFILTLAGLWLAVRFQQPKKKAQRWSCVNNLKNIGLAVRIFAVDHEGRNPWVVSVTNGGTAEFATDPGLTWRNFAVFSNSLSPKQVICPQDQAHRITANTWATNAFALNLTRKPMETGWVPFNQNSNVSFFLGLQANEEVADSVLGGDRALIVNGRRVQTVEFALTASDRIDFDITPHAGGGNILLGDGSVTQVGSNGLHAVFRKAGFATNQILVP